EFGLLEFRENLFEITIDDADLPPRCDAVAIVEHRVVLRKVEQTGAKLVEKPPVMLGFAVRLRHDRTPTQPYSDKSGEIFFSQSSGAFKAAAPAGPLPSPDDFQARLLTGDAVVTEEHINLHADRERTGLGEIDHHLDHPNVAQAPLIARVDATGIDQRRDR